MDTKTTKTNGQFWKNVMIGGIPGILIGSIGTGLVESAFAAQSGEVTPDPVTPALSPLSVAEVSDDMSFGEAYAAARGQVGPGGVFEWRGNVYNTYNAEEWDAMSPEDRAEFAERLTVTPVEVEQLPAEENDIQPDDVPANNPSNDDHTHEDEVVGEPDVEIEEVGVVVMEDGSEVVMATGQVEGHSALMADVDCDGVIDVMAVDTNDDDIIDDNEFIDTTDAGLTVEDAVLLAENNMSGDPSSDLYGGTPDYFNDADTSAFA